MKATKINYWITTVLIFLFEGVLPAFTSQSEIAKQGIRHLGYPEYFGNALVIFKVIGAILLVTPKLPNRVKEWTYAGFAFDFIFATISLTTVDGVKPLTLFPLFFLVILIVSYLSYQKLLIKPNLQA